MSDMYKMDLEDLLVIPESLCGIPVADHGKNLLECCCHQIWKLASCLCFSLKLGSMLNESKIYILP